MKKVLSRMLTLLTVFVISFSLLVVPAGAADSSGFSFWSWISGTQFVDFLKGLGDGFSKYSPDVGKSAYSDYVTALPTPNINSAGLSDFYITGWDYTYSQSDFGSFSGRDDYLSLDGDLLSSLGGSHFAYVGVLSGPFTVPVSGQYTLSLSNLSCNCTAESSRPLWLWSLVDGSYTLVSSTSFLQVGATSRPVTFDLQSGVTYYLSAGSSSITERGWGLRVDNFPSYHVSLSCQICITGNFAADSSVDYSSSTRTGSLAGDLFYEGDNGEVVAAENATLFDETNNTVNNYQTGTTATASSWTYDYATRTYTITATDGSTYTIQYGDDHATEAVEDGSGTSTTYNYYYGSGSSVPGNPDDPSNPDDPGGSSGGTIWDKIGELFGTIADGALAVIKAAVGKILDGLIDLCEMINEKLESVVNSILGLFDQIPKLFSGFTAFLAAVFPFIPQEIQNVLLLAACLLALIAIINAIRRR
jgi:hypothetical protein